MRFLLFVFFVLFSFSASAEEGCYDPSPVVDQTWVLQAGSRLDFYLPSTSSYGPFLTHAAAHFTPGPGELGIALDHNLPAGMVGLPYTVYRIELSSGDFYHSLDFTQNCSGPGLSFFPRETITLPNVKASLQPGETMRIRIWGHL